MRERKKRRCRWYLFFPLLLLFAGSRGEAHPLAPSLLEIIEKTPGNAEVLWKTPLMKIPGEALRVELPSGCLATGETESRNFDSARLERWKISCDAPLVGSRVGVSGISGSKADVILRVVLADGRKYQRVLGSEQPFFVVPERERAGAVFQNYWRLGVEHILTGWDHLLFVMGLVLLVGGGRRLLGTITAFTLGHSVTLSLAALGWVAVSPAAVEALIALSILVLAVELIRSPEKKADFFRRYPWGMAASFGLLHGLGFAGALAQVGLPAGEIPWSLFSFNLGIECGQLLFIGVLLTAKRLARNIPLPLFLKKTVFPAYFIGSLSAFWFFERLFRIWE
ncbi:MAG: HupE/UreJ family protein [bacterium]